jgi:2-C-methyl-D-erythritol 4-phosphate cytidylyltransferase
MQKYVVIAAGGSGLRMQTHTPKQFLVLGKQPIICHTIQRFLAAFPDVHIILSVPANYLDEVKDMMVLYFPNCNYTLVLGGATRFHSVQNGIQSITVDNAIVFVQDAARCLLSTTLIEACYAATIKEGNAIPCILPKDSLRIVNQDTNSILNRNLVRVIQTPQTFYLTDLRKAFQQTYNELFTDEASVMEHIGIPIHLIPGEENNIKITTPIDLKIAEWLLKDQ